LASSITIEPVQFIDKTNKVMDTANP